MTSRMCTCSGGCARSPYDEPGSPWWGKDCDCFCHKTSNVMVRYLDGRVIYWEDEPPVTGAGYLFVLGVVVCAAGWLVKDYHDRAFNMPESSGQPARPSSCVRVMREPRDWNREGWL